MSKTPRDGEGSASTGAAREGFEAQHPELRELGERLERRMFWLGLLGGVIVAIAVDLRAALVLTLTVAAAIVSIRGLRSQISVLSPIPGTSHSARSYVLVLTRALVLVVGLALIFRFGATRPTAVIAGVATLPTALFIEAIRQAFVNVD